MGTIYSMWIAWQNWANQYTMVIDGIYYNPNNDTFKIYSFKNGCIGGGRGFNIFPIRCLGEY